MRKEIEFRSLLKSFRVRKGPAWKQANTAEELGVSRRLYVAWENGESIPSQKQLIRIADYFELSKEDAEALYRAAAQAPPRVHNIPFKQNPFFTGRKTHLERLRKQLLETGTAEITQSISISGLGGIGKTQIALEYAHRHYPNVYLTVLWVNAADGTTLQSSYDSLAHILELPERNEREPDQRIRAVKRWLEGHASWLLIMDNADDLQLARSFLPATPLGHVVLTTRSQIVRDSNIAVQIKVEEMEPEEGLRFLLRRSGLLQAEDKLDDVPLHTRETALQLVELLGGLPLALDQAGAYIEETGILLADYIQLYLEEHHQLLDSRGPPGDSPSDHPESVTVTVQLSFRKACERHALAADVLYFCSFLQPDAMPEEVFYQDSGLELNIKLFNDVMAALRRYSLVVRNAQEKILAMHRLVQAVLSDSIPPDLRRQWRERVLRAVNASFPEVDFKDWKQCGRLLPHALVCAMWTDELTTTLEFSELLHKAGVYLREQGLYIEAEPLLVRALTIGEQRFGEGHPDTAVDLHTLAALYWQRGKYEQAISLCQRVLTIYEQQLGPEHHAVASVLNDLAILSRNTGKYEQAIRLHQRALTIREKRLGAEHLDTAKSMNNLAVLYWYQGKYDQVEPLYRRALAIHEKHLGAEHPDTAVGLHNLAELYQQQGKYEDAEPLYRRAISAFEKYLGPEHPNIASCLHSLAELYREQGKYEEAKPLYERALAIREQHLGAEHPFTARSLLGLAKLLQDQRKYEGVEALYQRALAIQEQQLGATHPHTQETRKDYAAFLRSI